MGNLRDKYTDKEWDILCEQAKINNVVVSKTYTLSELKKAMNYASQITHNKLFYIEEYIKNI